MEHYGIVSLMPAFSVLVLALVTKRTLEALIGGTLLGFIILEKQAFFGAFVSASLKVMGENHRLDYSGLRTFRQSHRPAGQIGGRTSLRQLSCSLCEK